MCLGSVCLGSVLLGSVLRGSVLLCLVTGCELGQNLKNIGQILGGSEGETVEGEGKELIKGNFYSLRFDGNVADGVFVMALEAREEELPRLRIIPFPDAQGACSAGPARRYAAATTRPGREGVALEARIPFEAVRSDESRSLRFTNFECDVDDVEVPDGSMPLSSSFANKPGFIVSTSAGELQFVNPWEGELELITDSLAPISRGGLALFAAGASKQQWLWTLEGGEIVARDADFRVRGRVGENVEEVQHVSDSSGPLLIYRQQDGAAYRVPVTDLSSPELIESDACELAPSQGTNGLELFYYSPCEPPRDLVLQELETGNRRILAEGVANYKFVEHRSDGPIFLYLAGDTGTSMWARFGEQSPVFIGEGGNLGLTNLTPEGQIKAVLDWGEYGGTFNVGEVGKELTLLARDVVYYTSLGVIADWDGALGTLYGFEDEELTPILRNVTTQGLFYDRITKRALVLVDYDGSQGELTMVRDAKGTPLSKRVRRDSYQFTVQLPTVTILSDLEPDGTATLKLRETDSETETIVSLGVSEVLEVNWPAAGFLYSVPLGDRNGIWFTEVR
jgi:hypothetical protein